MVCDMGKIRFTVSRVEWELENADNELYNLHLVIKEQKKTKNGIIISTRTWCQLKETTLGRAEMYISKFTRADIDTVKKLIGENFNDK